MTSEEKRLLLTHIVACAGLFFGLIAFYDWTHWDQLQARNACEAVPGVGI